MRGRKPTPTALKVLRGNPGKRALNQEEPVLPAPPPASDESIKPPRPLKGAALKEWERLVDDLVQAGVVTKGDLMPFWAYCWLVGQISALDQQIRKFGPVAATKLGYTNTMLKLVDRMMKAAADLGLNPSARSRVRAVKPPVKDAAEERRRKFFGNSSQKPA